MAENLRIVMNDSKQCQTTSFIGELDLDSHDEVVHCLTSVKASAVVVDLSRVTFIDARGIGALVAARNQMGHRLEFRGAHGFVRRVFAVAGVESLLQD
jgi:anti-anti-sigma factor